MNNKIAFFTKPYPWVRNHQKLIDEAAAHGLSVVEGFNDGEFALPDMEAAKRLRTYADERGVRFCCFSCFADLTGDRAAEMVQRMKKYALVAEILGAPYLHHTVIPEYNAPERVLPRREDLLRQGIEGVREIFDFAAEHGVRAAYEDQGFILNGVQGFGDFLERVDRPVSVVADFGNICQTKEPVTEFLRAFGKRVVHVHLKDYALRPDADADADVICAHQLVQVPLGEGMVPVREAIELLKQLQYTGCYSLEFSSQVADIKDSVSLVQKLIQ